MNFTLYLFFFCLSKLPEVLQIFCFLAVSLAPALTFKPFHFLLSRRLFGSFPFGLSCRKYTPMKYSESCFFLNVPFLSLISPLSLKVFSHFLTFKKYFLSHLLGLITYREAAKEWPIDRISLEWERKTGGRGAALVPEAVSSLVPGL